MMLMRSQCPAFVLVLTTTDVQSTTWMLALYRVECTQKMLYVHTVGIVCEIREGGLGNYNL